MLIHYKINVYSVSFFTFQDIAEEEIEAEMGVVRLVSYETNAVFTVKNGRKASLADKLPPKLSLQLYK